MNRKLMFLRVLFGSLLIFTFVLIFIFSSEDAPKSSSTSKSTMHEIIYIIKGNKEVSQTEIDKFDPILRKLAHFSIYTLSGIWAMCFVNTFYCDAKYTHKFKKLKTDFDVQKLFLSTLIGFVYACTDEFHQLFIAGRSGEFMDVMIDTMGVLNGALLALLIIKIISSSFSNKLSLKDGA